VWGEWYSAFAPIYDSEGNAVGAVGVDMRVTIFKELGQRIMNSILISFPVSLAVMSLMVIGISVNISRPIIQLTASAELVAQGKYEEAIAPEHDPLIRDETYTLSTVFELMVDKVREREQKLKERIQELEIVIDEGKKVAQVQEIVESEFFVDLKEKAAQMRGRAKKQSTGVKKKARASAEK
jgi:signal transduction histidine kinase